MTSPSYTPTVSFSPAYVPDVHVISPVAQRLTSCELPHGNIFSHLWHPMAISECLEMARQRWATTDRHTLASLWWYSASHSILAMAFSTWLADGTMVIPRPDDPVAIRTSDGYLAGWIPQMARDLDSGLNELTQMISPIIAGLSKTSGRSCAPYWSLASDAPAMAATAISIRLPARQRLRVWRQLEAFHLSWQRFAPIPRLRLLESELRSGSATLTAPVDTTPPPRAYRRNSCCLLYRVPGEKNCRNCPKLPRTPRPVAV